MLIQSFRTKYVNEHNVRVLKGFYGNGETALVVKSEHGEPLCTATVNMIDYDEVPQRGHVFLKLYAENEGVLEALQAAGIVGEPVRYIDAGFATQGVAEVPLLNPDEIEELR